jgi:hypothetical protein
LADGVQRENPVIAVPGSELGRGGLRRVTLPVERGSAYKPTRSTRWTGQIEDS